MHTAHPACTLQGADYFAALLSGRWRDAGEAAVPLGDKLTEKGVVDVMLFLCNSEAGLFPGDVEPLRVSEFISAADFLGCTLPDPFLAFLAGVLHHQLLTVQPMEGEMLRVVSSRCFVNASPSISASDGVYVAVRLSDDFAKLRQPPGFSLDSTRRSLHRLQSTPRLT